MSFNGSGTFVINSSGQPVVANTVISSTVFNALTADLATGLSTCITKDGQTTPTANIPMGTFKFTNLGVGSAATDSATLGQVQASTTKLVTVTGTDTITGTMTPALTAYATGQMFYFVAGATNTNAVTLNIDGLGAKSVTRHGSTALVAGDILSGEVCVVVYDGTRFQLLNPASYTNLSYTGTLTGGTGIVNLGSGQFYKNASGNVGIGTASPTSKLDVNGNGAFSGTLTATLPSSVGAIVARNSSTTASELAVRPALGKSGWLSFTEETVADRWIVGIKNGNGGLYFNTGNPSSNTDRMVLDSSGNLGIGTASPQSKLHIDGGDFRNSSGTLPALSTSIVSGEIHSGITNTGTTDSGYLRLSAGGGTTLGVKAAIDIFRESGGTAGVVFYTSGTERGRIDANGNTIAGGSVALATTATNGFLYVPTCAGTPTGTPTAITGMVPIVVNTTNNKLYFYSGGAWRDAGP